MNSLRTFERLLKKPKAELLELAVKHQIPAFQKMNKSELAEALVKVMDENESTISSQTSFWGKFSNHIYGLASVVGLALAVYAFFPKDKDKVEDTEQVKIETPALREHSIAILPFEDMSPKKDQGYFGEGIAEEILNTLTKLTELKVAGRTSSFSFKDKDDTIEEIGQKLNVRHVLEGSIRKQGGKLRVTAQLIDASNGFHLWSETFDRAFDNIFEIQDELSSKIGSMILGELSPGQIDRITNNSNINPKAFELFLESNAIHKQFYILRIDSYFIESEKKFKEAIALEPNYAMAYAGLADLYDTKRYVLTDSSEMKYYEELKTKTIKKALDLNPNLPYVQLTQGWVYLNRQIEAIDFEGAFQSFKKAHDLDQRNSDGLVGMYWLYDRFDLVEDCNKIMKKILEINPNSGEIYDYKATFESKRGLYDKVIETCKQGLTVDDSFISLYRYLGQAYFYENKFNKCIEALNKVNELNPEYFEKNKNLQVILALANDDIEKAKKINPNSSTLNSYLKNYEALNTNLFDNLKKRKQNKIYKDFSFLTYLQKHPHFQHLQNTEVYKKEIEYHTNTRMRGYERLPRAETFL